MPLTFAEKIALKNRKLPGFMEPQRLPIPPSQEALMEDNTNGMIPKIPIGADTYSLELDSPKQISYENLGQIFGKYKNIPSQISDKIREYTDRYRPNSSYAIKKYREKPKEDWVLGTNEVSREDDFEQRKKEEEARNVRNAEAMKTYANAPPIRDTNSDNVLKGVINLAFPQTSLLLGGQAEADRRGEIADKYPSVVRPNVNDTPILLPSKEKEAYRRSRQRANNTVTVPQGTAPFQKGTGEESLPVRPATDNKVSEWTPVMASGPQRAGSFSERSQGIANRISPENPYGADVVNGGVRVGAATDAEAARNLVARAEQDKATQSAVAGFDRATEALKSLREVRSPAFRFGVDSIGGGPDALDVASGRVINRDTPANAVSDAMANASRKTRLMGGSRAAAQDAADKVANLYTTDKAVQQSEITANTRREAAGDSPLDVGRFLLDQSKFGQQQEADKARYGIDVERLKTEQTANKLKEREYSDKKRGEFLSGFTYPDEGAPTDRIGSAVWQMSEASGVSPEEITPFFKAAADEKKIDWKNILPKDFDALAQRAMVLMTQAKRSQ